MSHPPLSAPPSEAIAARSSGCLPPWGEDDLPEPPPLSFRNALRVIGPGAILLATAIGGGEWLVGPAAAVKYGTGLFGIATVAIALQVVFNLEAIRYTLYTGEPIFGAFLRLRPGPEFWAVFYTLFAVLQLAWPALALAAAGTLFSLVFGRLPGGVPFDATLVQLMGAGVIVTVAIVLLFGGTIERTLERASWIMVAYIFVFLGVANVVFVPAAHSLQTLRGFFTLESGTGTLDWTLLCALAIGAGAGGLGNLTISSWYRDKGFGMGARVGAIASAVGSRHTTLSPVGVVFPVTGENLRRFRLWWKYAHIDQVLVWGLFCFVGLFLTTNLATGVVPPGTNLEGLGTGAYQAEHMGRLWRGLFYLTLLNGFWILFSTQLGNTDMIVRTATDLLWMGSPRVRRFSKERVSRVYYAGLVLLSLWGIVTLRMGGAFGLMKLITNVGALLVVVSGIQILVVGRRFLPPALRPTPLRKLLFVGAIAFYGFFLVRAVAGWLGLG